MYFKQLAFVLTLLLTSFPSIAFNCAKSIEKMDKCGASFGFTYTYELVCTKGNELTAADITSILKSHEREVSENSCLQAIYVIPRTDRSTARGRHNDEVEYERAKKYDHENMADIEKQMHQQIYQQKKYRQQRNLQPEGEEPQS